MSVHIKKFRKGFKIGKINQITYDDDDTGINLSIVIANKNHPEWSIHAGRETCLVLLNGHGRITSEDFSFEISRNSLFKENPTCIHFNNRMVTLRLGNTNTLTFAWLTTNNFENSFFHIYTPENIKSEIRGKGTMKRTVKTIFDYSTRPDSHLVVGEVINLPGRYSSAPPHHHPQPEIYFYRFMPKQGFGFAELGENQAFKVKHNDAIKILNNVDHMQTAAPGYYMWYLWVVRHLPGNPYKGFEYNPKHKWVLGDKK